MENIACNLGFPRMGKKRELKFALEKFWNDQSEEDALQATGRNLRCDHWRLQVEAGIQTPPSNDFSFYDHVLDTAVMLGAIPERFHCSDGPVDIKTYFAMARGTPAATAMEMTKWFDTNYHYVVPEFERGMHYRLRSTKVIDHYIEAKELGIVTRPVILGPLSFVLLGKPTHGSVFREDVLNEIVPIYEDLLKRLYAAGAAWVQIDEPCLCTDLDPAAQRLYRDAYRRLTDTALFPKLLLTTYFADLGANLDLALSIATAGMHVDLVRAPQQLHALLANRPAVLRLSLGLVDGRNVWRTDIKKALILLEAAVQNMGKDQIEVAPSCSLLHAPLDLSIETKFDPELRTWMAFGQQKLEEVVVLARALEGRQAIQHELEKDRDIARSRETSSRIHNAKVQERLQAVDDSMLHRKSPYPARRAQQAKTLSLPSLPTTTIGSFPQTDDVRKMRAAVRTGKIDQVTYDAFLEREIERAIRFQERVGLDVLVHGEFERNDMVEYFSEQLEGFVFSQHGWVQSYGSRCVKPPIIYGDVWRPAPITVRWTTFAQSLSNKPVKGMLTGPVTILQWSFVRDDQPRADTCRQIALAIRDEVEDLELAGIRIVQIDEPAIREGLPLHRAEWAEYLQWSVDAFRLASSVASDDTQIHTHMCYSEFNDIIDSIARMDADVISIECSRSRMELLDAFHHVRYPNAIGPGVYDIHSPRVPNVEEMEDLLRRAIQVLSPEQLWINPDCGLKTRGWPEVDLALKNMVKAAQNLRQSV